MFTTTHIKNLTANLQAMRKNKIGTDVVIVSSQGGQFYAHKIILTATSKYFETLFSTAGNEEASSEVVNLNDLSPDVVEEVLNFLYTGVLQKLPEDPLKVRELFEAAHFFQTDEMIKRCVCNLSDSMGPNNLETAWEIGHKYGIEHLKFKVADLLVEDVIWEDYNGSARINLETIKKVQPIYIMFIFKELERNTTFPDLADAVLAWVNHDKKNRKTYLVDLMYLIGINSYPFDSVKLLAKDELIRESGELMQLLLVKALQ